MLSLQTAKERRKSSSALTLEFVGCLEAGVVAELEALATVEGVAALGALRTERVERLEEEIFRRYVACADGEATDTVEVAIRQALGAVAAEEGAVTEILIVRKGAPAARDVRVRMADVGAEHPERRARAAAGVATVLIATAVEVTTGLRRIDTPVKGQTRSTEAILRTETEYIGNVHLLAVGASRTVIL